MKTEDMAGATVSDCGLYRYRLWRAWGRGPGLLWIMLNPSTADARKDDPTIRRCAGFTKTMGFSHFEVMNLFALRATDPSELVGHPDPVGPDNDEGLRIACRYRGGLIIVAWGSASKLPRELLQEREEMIKGLTIPSGLKCLGFTRDGHPKHPLYVPKDASLMTWPIL